MSTSFKKSAVAALLASGVFASSAGAAPQVKCLVKVNAGKTFAGKSSLLVRKLAAAAPGDTLHLGGICTGNFVLSKDVSLVGDLTPGDTNLIGGPNGAALSIGDGVSVTIAELYVNGGTSPVGGVESSGNLTLAGGAVVLAAASGSGVTNSGTLTMTGDAEISTNFSFASGAGLYNTGSATVTENASIHGNTAAAAPGFSVLGGGVFNSGSLVLRDNASVSDNFATVGGGIFNDGSLTLEDNASVTDNVATSEGGAIDEGANSVITVDPAWAGSTCSPENSPNDFDASNSGAACP